MCICVFASHNDWRVPFTYWAEKGEVEHPVTRAPVPNNEELSVPNANSVLIGNTAIHPLQLANLAELRVRKINAASPSHPPENLSQC